MELVAKEHLDRIKEKLATAQNDYEIVKFQTAQLVEYLISQDSALPEEHFTEEEIDSLLTWKQDWEIDKVAEIAAYNQRFELNLAKREENLKARAERRRSRQKTHS